jgi:hypothetical protein
MLAELRRWPPSLDVLFFFNRLLSASYMVLYMVYGVTLDILECPINLTLLHRQSWPDSAFSLLSFWKRREGDAESVLVLSCILGTKVSVAVRFCGSEEGMISS